MDTLSRQDKKDALGRKTAVHNANADLVRELRVPSDADDIAIQEALKRLFNSQVQEQVKDQTASDAVDGQTLKASVSDQISSVQSSSIRPESESKTSSSF